MIWRDWVQPNTQGMALRSAMPEVDDALLDGREPMFMPPNSSTGVDDPKYSTRPGVSMNSR